MCQFLISSTEKENGTAKKGHTWAGREKGA